MGVTASSVVEETTVNEQEEERLKQSWDKATCMAESGPLERTFSLPSE